MDLKRMGSRPKIYERDIDALLERRLRNDRDFAQRLIDTILGEHTPSIDCENVVVERQVPHEGSTGTIDLVLKLFSISREMNALLLVENKLESGFTPGQPDRYAASAVALSRAGRPAIPVVCAPRDYLARSRHLAAFQAQVSYETVAEWLEGEDQELVSAAVHRFQMPYEPDPVPAVSDFHEGYSALVDQIAPELVVKPNPNPRGGRPKASRTLYFIARRCLPHYNFLPTLRFSHQCWDSSAPSPSVKVMFGGWAQHEDLLRRIAAPHLANTGFYLRRAGSSLGLVHDTPRMDNTHPVGEQIEAVTAGIRAAVSLRAWMYSNEETLRHWAGSISGENGRS